jgi:WhiB family redox-sensing transcriptional regulator
MARDIPTLDFGVPFLNDGDWVPCMSDPESWFPTPGQTYSSQRARRMCSDCPVKVECLNYVLELDLAEGGQTAGIWGGTTEVERKQMLVAARLNLGIPRRRSTNRYTYADRGVDLVRGRSA